MLSVRNADCRLLFSNSSLVSTVKKVSNLGNKYASFSWEYIQDIGKRDLAGGLLTFLANNQFPDVSQFLNSSFSNH